MPVALLEQVELFSTAVEIVACFVEMVGGEFFLFIAVRITEISEEITVNEKSTQNIATTIVTHTVPLSSPTLAKA